MRLLWAKVGKVHCAKCGRQLGKQSASQIVDTITKMPDGKKIFLLAPVVQGRKGEHAKIIDAIKREGFVRMRVDGAVVTTDEETKLDPKKAHTIEIVIDRMIVRDLEIQEGKANPNRSRLADSVELALKKGEGSLIVMDADSKEETRFAESFVCPEHPDLPIPDIEPRSFSFNSPHGACETCHGIGSILQVDESAVIPNVRLSLGEGAIHPWATSASRTGFMMQMLESLSEEVGFSMTTPWEKLTEEQRKIILWGYPKPLTVSINTMKFGGTYQTNYEGVIPNLRRRHEDTDSNYMRQQIEEYMLELPCDSCGGKRLRKEILAVTVGNANIVDATDMSVDTARTFFESLMPQSALSGRNEKADRKSALSDYEFTIVKKVLTEIAARLSFLENVGLKYLTLSRSAATLSGGEAQRIRLATQIGSALQGVLYVLDEPSRSALLNGCAVLLHRRESLPNARASGI
jgi:excinuclease ABC subunit A